jgi:[protein-PII] uridylyltransferase
MPIATTDPATHSITHKLALATRCVDKQLQCLWQNTPTLNQCVLAAVGGYGRCEMYPHSDVDLLIVHPLDLADISVEHSEAIAEFVRNCWDIGLQIGHSVRTINQCLSESAQDITVQTALLEARLLAGDSDLFNRMQQAFLQQLNPADFLRAKTLEMQQRHQRHENTPYSLEPNCKESPGGLRDLHVLMWVAKAAGLTKSNSPAANYWKDLRGQAILSRAEMSSLHRAEHTIQAIRFTLHTVAKRREDRLVFDLQNALAESLGYTAKPGRRASEVLMQKYYLAAKAISQLNGLLLQALERRILGESAYQQTPLSPAHTHHYCEQNGFLHALDLSQFARDPLSILHVFHILAENPHLRDLSADTQRAVWNARRYLVSVRHTDVFKTSFMLFFERGTGLTRTFRRMNALSVLSHCLPPFRRIVGQMQHDLFHVYTVDQHILTVLRNVRRFVTPQHVHEYPLCSQLIAQFEPKSILYIAALFHDIGKGRGGDHSDIGQRAVRRFGRSMNLSPIDLDLAIFLVKHHLTLSMVAQKTDLSDTDVIAKFANIVGTEQRLTALYLLTVADIRGTSPKVWNAWKAKLIEDLYQQTLRYLNSDETPNPLHNSAHTAQNLVLALLPTDLSARAEALWENWDDAYFLRNDSSDAAWHTQTLLNKHVESTVVSSRIAPNAIGLQVMVYAKDQTELFGRLCSCFDKLSLSVLDAQVYTTRTGYALDHFVLELPAMMHNELHALITHLEQCIKTSLSTLSVLPAPRSSRLPRQARHFAFEPRVHLMPDERNNGKTSIYLLELQAVDQTSLLYRIAQVFARHAVSVHTARITTLGSRAEDFFLISGEALETPKTQLHLETDLLATLQV